jgi:Tol biopolymer transport system component
MEIKMKIIHISAIITILLLSCSRDYDENLKIVYQHNDGSYNQIYTMDEDGTNVKQLTNTLANNTAPSWSADDEKIVFASNRDGSSKIYIMNSDGSGVYKLSDQLVYSPTWSPDGSKISFYYTDGDFELYIINSDGSGLTNVTNNGVIDSLSSWFPDSYRLAFLQENNIYTMTYTGTELTQITTTGSVSSISVSPYGNKFAYEYINAIWVMNSDGTNPVNLTSSYVSQAQRASWSPSGESIVFASNSFPREISVINSDGTGYRQLTSDSFDDDYPCFQGKPK